MKDKLNQVFKLMFPYHKLNIFVVCLFFLSVIIGAIYSNIIGIDDQELVIEKINSFINNINSNSLYFVNSYKNSIIINFSYLFIVWIFGMTIFGVLFIILILFLKGFIIGFSVSSFIITYSYKGLILSIFYIIFGQLLNIFIILSISVYSIAFTYKLLELIFKQKNINFKKNVKIYFLILIILFIVSVFSSLCETYFLPAIIKLVIKLFI